MVVLLALPSPALADPFAVQFTAVPTSGPAPLTVAFTDTSQYSNTWSWSFGDGETSTDQNPVHIYQEPGTYVVRLTSLTGMMDPLQERSAEATIAVGTPTPTTAPISTVTTTGPTGTITGNVTGNVITVVPTGNVTTILTSTQTTIPPTGSSSQRRAYPPSLILYPTVTPKSYLVTVDGAATAATGTTISRISWNWGDGSVDDHMVPNTHTFAAAGSYTITVTAYQSDDQSTTKSMTVFVTGPAETTNAPSTTVTQPPGSSIAAFTWAPDAANRLRIQFTDASTGPVTARIWDFGDGGTSTEQDPVHVYARAGIYPVVLTAQGPGGASTAARNLSVGELDTPPVTPTVTATIVPPTATATVANITPYPTPLPPPPDLPWVLVAIAAVGLLAGGVAVAKGVGRRPPTPDAEVERVPGLTIEARGGLRRPCSERPPKRREAEVEIEMRGGMRRG